MGANWSQHNAVHLQLLKAVYQDGDIVHAVVALNLVEPLPVADISVQVRAVEKTCWATTYSGGFGQVKQARNLDRGGTATLMHAAVDLELPGPAGRELAPGRYQWGVVFALPPGSPSTFEQDWGDAGAYLSYEASVVIRSAGKHAPMLAREFFTVHQKPQEAHGAEHSEELLLGKGGSALNPFKPHGVIAASLKLAQAQCLPGGDIELLVAVDNRSSAAVKSIEVGLERDIMLQEEPGCVASQHGFRELCSKHATAQGVPANSAAERHVRVAMPAELGQQPSLSGSLISCSYSARATLKMGLFGEDLHIPLRMLAPQGADGGGSGANGAKVVAQPPAGWQPTQVFPPVALSLPGAAPLPADALQQGPLSMAVSSAELPAGAA
ncbi:hypothetical protein ABPG75_001266 [Micractinium tetrahymenae]